MPCLGYGEKGGRTPSEDSWGRKSLRWVRVIAPKAISQDNTEEKGTDLRSLILGFWNDSQKLECVH